MNTYRSRFDGFTLVEMMVAITISLIILVAVSSLFVSTKRTYNEQDRQAKMQEGARFALNFLTYDLRQAGYFGCLDDINTQTVNSTVNASASLFLNALIPIEGIENAAGSWHPSGNTTLPAGIKSNTDAIVLRMSSPTDAVSISDPMPNTSAELKVSAISGINDGDILMISDCSSADVFQVTAVQTSSLHIQHNAGGSTPPGNSTQQLSKRYSPPAQVFKFLIRTYFIRDNNGVPGLFRQDNGGTPVELVPGVDQLQITYGKDTDNPPDKVPNVYLRAGDPGLITPADWSRVRTVRIGLLVRTTDDKTRDKDPHTTGWTINGQAVAAFNDTNRRQQYEITVNMRNL